MSQPTETVQSDGLNTSLTKLRDSMVAGELADNLADNIGINARYLCHVEGNGGLSLSSWEYPIVWHRVTDDFHEANQFILGQVHHDEAHQAMVLDTLTDEIVAAAGMHLPPLDQQRDIVRVIRNRWIGLIDRRYPSDWEINACPPATMPVRFAAQTS